ncbi:hypothetical protein PUN28_016751 [Cardiocondyla obscurior]|uniref:Secreted protein n=1 Tax=Cardiocondyla obscurior TaxID=286306 RepID=A0AAW2EQP3_9HYME
MPRFLRVALALSVSRSGRPGCPLSFSLSLPLFPPSSLYIHRARLLFVEPTLLPTRRLLLLLLLVPSVDSHSRAKKRCRSVCPSNGQTVARTRRAAASSRPPLETPQREARTRTLLHTHSVTHTFSPFRRSLARTLATARSVVLLSREEWDTPGWFSSRCRPRTVMRTPAVGPPAGNTVRFYATATPR